MELSYLNKGGYLEVSEDWNPWRQMLLLGSVFLRRVPTIHVKYSQMCTCTHRATSIFSARLHCLSCSAVLRSCCFSALWPHPSLNNRGQLALCASRVIVLFPLQPENKQLGPGCLLISLLSLTFLLNEGLQQRPWFSCQEELQIRVCRVCWPFLLSVFHPEVLFPPSQPTRHPAK